MIQSILDQFTKEMERYLEGVHELIEQQFANRKDEVLPMLEQGKKTFNALMEQLMEETKEEENGLHRKDVQYTVVNGILLANDLYQFYQENLYERFTLRVENYRKRERVNQLFR